MVKKIKAKVPSTSREMAKLIAQTLHDHKGKEIKVLDLRKLASFSDYFVIASGTSDRHVQSLCDHIIEKLRSHKIRPMGMEGYSKGHWILVDFGNVVAHLFFEETRSFYALEKLWADAKPVQFRLK